MIALKNAAGGGGGGGGRRGRSSIGNEKKKIYKTCLVKYFGSISRGARPWEIGEKKYISKQNAAAGFLGALCKPALLCRRHDLR